MEEISLAEAYRRRESIDAAGQAIYCRGRRTGSTHRIVFHARQPGGNWFNVWLVEEDDAILVAMHAEASVYLDAASTDHLRIRSQEVQA